MKFSRFLLATTALVAVGSPALAQMRVDRQTSEPTETRGVIEGEVKYRAPAPATIDPSDPMLGDDLGSHTATQPLDMSNQQIVNIGTPDGTNATAGVNVEFLLQQIDQIGNPDLSEYVTRNTNQTISGDKIFTGDVIVPTTPTDSASAVNRNFVMDTFVTIGAPGVNQNVLGNKTFQGTVIFDGVVRVPNPVMNSDATSKIYVDNAITNAGANFVTLTTDQIIGGTPISGNKGFTGTVTLGGEVNITTTPDDANDATNKLYVDGLTDGLEGRIVTIEGAVATLQTDVTNLQGNVTTLNSRVTALENRTLTAGSGITTTGTLGGGLTVAVNNTVIRTTGNQSMTGIKTFASIPVLPAASPTLPTQAASKAYVDGQIAAIPAADLTNYVTIDGTQTITGAKTFAAPIVGSITGNAGTANALLTPRNINGVPFDGNANITLPTVNTTGDQGIAGIKAFADLPLIPTITPTLPGQVASKSYVDGRIAAIPATDLTNYVTLNGTQTVTGTKTFSAPIVGSITGNAGTANALLTPRNINGVPFDGNANITLPTVNTTGDQAVSGIKTFASTIVGSVSGNAGTATTLQTPRAINGVAFNGAADIALPTVNLAGNQTVADMKTFTGTVNANGVLNVNGTGFITTMGTVTTAIANKGYVDTKYGPLNDLDGTENFNALTPLGFHRQSTALASMALATSLNRPTNQAGMLEVINFGGSIIQRYSSLGGAGAFFRTRTQTGIWGGWTAAGSDNLGNHTAFMDLDMAANQIFNLGAPANPNDAATKAYVDAADGNNVKLTGNQTVAGIKTFASTIVGSLSGNAATATAFQTARTINGVTFNGTANITLPTVNTTGAQTIADVKTFTATPVLPAAFPTVATQAANKGYVDTKIGELADIPATANLNTFIAPGFHRAPIAVPVLNQSLLNWPSASPGFLEVIEGAGAVSQVFTRADGTAKYFRTRTTAGTWSAWRQFASGGAGDNLGSHIATQDIIAGGFKVTDLGAPTLPGDATNKAYVDGQLALIPSAGSLTGSNGVIRIGNDFQVDATVIRNVGNQTIGGNKTFTGSSVFTGGVSINNTRLQNVANPTAPTDGVNRQYVDGVVSSLTGDNLGNHTATSMLLIGPHGIDFEDALIESTALDGTRFVSISDRLVLENDRGLDLIDVSKLILKDGLASVSASRGLSVSTAAAADQIRLTPATTGSSDAFIALTTPSAGLTGNRTVALPDGNVALVPGTMATIDTAQTISGVKTFTAPIVGSVTGNAGTATALQTARTINGVAFNGSSNITLPSVNLTGAQTIADVKTFTSIPVLPGTLPTLAAQAANKAYVDAQIAAIPGAVPYTASNGVSLVGNDFRADATVVRTTGDQTIAGVKTLTGNVIAGANLSVGGTLDMTAGLISNVATPVAATDAATKGYVDAADVENVKLTGNQTVAGVKTFTAPIVGSVTGNAGTATALQTARTINGVAFNGSSNINLPSVNLTGAQTIADVKTFTSIPVIPVTTPTLPGQAASKSYVDAQIAAVPGGVFYTASNGVELVGDDFQADVTVVRTSGDQSLTGVKTFTSTIVGSVSGNAATATVLQAARTINGVAFNGSTNITLPTVNTTGAQAVGGVKTFADLPVIPVTTPTLPGQAASKSYVDAQIAAVPGGVAYTASNGVALVGTDFRADATVVRTTGDQSLAGIKTFTSTIVGSVSGNAGTATVLQAARTINGVAFNGSADINVDELRATNGTTGITTTGTVAAVNHLDFRNAPAGGTVIARAEGADVNIPLTITSKGTGSLTLDTGSTGGVINLRPGNQGVRFYDSADDNFTSLVTGDLTANRTLTLADGNTTLSSGAMATTDTTQTISGPKTFTAGNAFTGTVTVPTPTFGAQAANKAYVDALISAVPGGVPYTASNGVALVGNDFRADATVVRTTGNQLIADDKFFTGTLSWGLNGTRSETKDDAGVSGAGARSGFYATSAPVNYYPGAASWQHMIESRHIATTNNYSMQIAGSFFDQNLWFRKTNNNATQAWTQIATVPLVQGLDAQNVKVFGTQNISGTKNFDATVNLNVPAFLSTMGTATTAVVNKSYVDNGFVNTTTTQTVNGAKTFTGVAVFTGGLSANGTRVQNVGTPTVSTDAVNRAYVDTGFVNVPFTQTITGLKTFSGSINANSLSNGYANAGVELLGNGAADTVFPSIGFHQPGLYAGQISLRGDGDFRFLDTANSNNARITAGTITGTNMFATSYFYSSDARLKDNVRDTEGLDVLKDVRPVTYTWKDSGKTAMGVIAQEVEEVYPFIVSEREDGMKTVDYAQLISPMLAAIQELDARVKALEADRN